MGLKATRRTMSSPLEMPPCTPPEWFVVVRGRPSGPGTKGSLCSRPVIRVAPNPEPISNPFVAGSDMIALARSASSLSNTGSPHPGGTERATHVTTPPSESPSRRAASIASVIRAAAAGSGQRVGSASTSARVTTESSTLASMVWMRLTQDNTSMPNRLARSLRATAPAATRPMVSRAEARPPPAAARMPYLASVV